MWLLFQGAVCIQNSPPQGDWGEVMMTNPAGDRRAAEGISGCGTHTESPLYISVLVLGVKRTQHTCIMLKAFCLNIYAILARLKRRQLRGCAEWLARDGGWWGLGTFWGDTVPRQVWRAGWVRALGQQKGAGCCQRLFPVLPVSSLRPGPQNPPQAAPWTLKVPWLEEEGEMKEVQSGWMGTVFLLEEMGMKERERRQGKNSLCPWKKLIVPFHCSLFPGQQCPAPQAAKIT